MGADRPSVDFEIEQIPSSMMSARRWMAWKPVERDGKWTKVPIDAETGNPGSSTEPARWTDFGTAVEEATRNGWGIGFALGDGWVGVDFDGVTRNTELADWVHDWATKTDTYVEESVSGTGVHAVMFGGEIPEWSQNRRGPVEIYQSGRYFTVSGKALYFERDAVADQASIDAVCERWLRKETPFVAAPPTGPLGGAVSSDPSADDFAYCVGLAKKGLRQHEIEAVLRPRMEAQGRAEKAARRDYVPRTVAAAIAAAGPVEAEDEPLQIVGMADLMRANPAKQPYVINRLLRRSEVGAVIAPPKCQKSFLILDLAVSVATGADWFGQFSTKAGKVLLVDNELAEQEIADRARRVMAERGIDPDDTAGSLEVMALREHDRPIGPILRQLEETRYDLVIFDALYMFLEEGMSENDNADMTVLLRKFRRFASRTDAAVMLVHHTTKGIQAGKDSIDLGSGASSFGRAVDTNVGIYRHEDDDAFVVEFKTRSSAPVGKLGMRWSYPCFSPAMSLDLEALYTGRKARKRDE